MTSTLPGQNQERAFSDEPARFQLDTLIKLLWDRGVVMSDQEILAKLDDIIARLERIEQRQIAVREEIKEAAPPVTGSFASTSEKAS